MLGAVENVIVGPIIAVLSFVCSVGNVPLAAVLWSGGISFAGVLAFLFADLIVLPIIAIYRKYYGTRFALRIVALMFVTMVARRAGHRRPVQRAGLIPTGPRPSRGDIFGTISVDYKLVLNVLAVAVFAALFWLTRASRRDRPDVRHEGRQGQGGAHGLRRGDVLLLLRALPARVRGRSASSPRLLVAVAQGDEHDAPVKRGAQRARAALTRPGAVRRTPGSRRARRSSADRPRRSGAR